MALLPLRVLPPISVCSREVTVDGQFAGSEVNVYAAEKRVAGGTAVGSPQSFPLDQPLEAGAKLWAEQVRGTAKSPPPAPSELVPVSAKPALADNLVALPGPLYVGATCVEVTNVVPGALVSAESTDGVPRGSGREWAGRTVVSLNAPLAAGEQLRFSQQACAESSKELLSPPASAARVHGEAALPAPRAQPSHACDTRVGFTGVLVGATVILELGDGKVERGCVPRATGAFDVPALVKGQLLRLSQTLDGVTSAKAAFTVGVGGKPPTPTVAPLCAGAGAVIVNGLRPGSTVELFVDGKSLGQAASDGGSGPFPLGVRLKNGQQVQARQGTCNPRLWSARAKPVTVKPEATLLGPAFPGAKAYPFIQGDKLYAGAPAVGVVASPYARVTLRNDAGEVRGPSVYSPYPGLLAVDGGLVAAEVVHVHEEGCGASKRDSIPPVKVRPLPQEMAAPVTRALVVEGDRFLGAAGVLPGAYVDFFVSETWYASAFAPNDAGAGVTLEGGVKLGWKLKARQRIGERVSPWSTPVTVRPPWPKINPFTLPTAVEGKPYSFTVQATGGVPPYSWSSKQLAGFGLAIDKATGTISGLPTGGGYLELNCVDSGIPPLGAPSAAELVFQAKTPKPPDEALPPAPTALTIVLSTSYTGGVVSYPGRGLLPEVSAVRLWKDGSATQTPIAFDNASSSWKLEGPGGSKWRVEADVVVKLDSADPPHVTGGSASAIVNWDAGKSHRTSFVLNFTPGTLGESAQTSVTVPINMDV